LSEQFRDELAAAKANLLPDKPPDPTPKSCDEEWTEQAPMAQSASRGHRAGFDAFMTGYIFASYCQQSSPPTADITHEQLLGGVAEFRNCINNTGLATPIRIGRSQYSKPSEHHRVVWTDLTSKKS